MRAENDGDGDRASTGRPPGDFSIIDDGLWAGLTAAVAAAAAVTLTAPRTARIKADMTPVTVADEQSQAALLEALASLTPGVAVVSEEMAVRPSRPGDVFLLIDPVDGTREFMRGSGEYTVNLAVIRNGMPAAGIVAVPAAGVIYRGRVRRGAERLTMSPQGAVHDVSRPVRVRTAPTNRVVAMVSRSHPDPATAGLLDRLHVENRIPCGSALKFCRIADGAADIYPRLAPTHEWDVGAGHALIVAAGGTVTRPDGDALIYGDAAGDFRVPGFIAWGDRAGVLDMAGAARK